MRPGRSRLAHAARGPALRRWVPRVLAPLNNPTPCCPLPCCCAHRYGTVSCGPASDALVAQLAAKAARYTADWGPGAFVLKYGFCEALSARLGELMGSQAGLVGLLSADSLPPLAVADGECELATGLGVTDDLKGGYSTGSDTHGRHSSSDSDFDSLTVSEGR